LLDIRSSLTRRHTCHSGLANVADVNRDMERQVNGVAYAKVVGQQVQVGGRQMAYLAV